ncbi:hypothetical protein [Proteus terrae]|uniref:hypothetical protein n=1 Tax=Proteus terrae TaxID=1574161 RepID=UPI00301B9AD5
MIDLNNISNFERKVSFSTKRDFFNNDNLTITKNIKKISNTEIEFNLVKKIFSGIKRLSTLLFVSQTGRIGISNRKENVEKCQETISLLQEKLNKNNIDLNNLNLEKENNNIALKNDLEVEQNSDLKEEKNELNQKLIDMTKLSDSLLKEREKIDLFITLIKNENSKFKDRYSFFNYLNELQRAEYFCRKSNDETEKKIADVFENILKERLGRVKGSDIKKIYNEIISTYQFESAFLDEREKGNILSKFSTSENREKFLSKINFLVLLLVNDPKIMNACFNKVMLNNLLNIMSIILGEGNKGNKVDSFFHQIKDAWIPKYMNEFYESKRTEAPTSTEAPILVDVSTSTDLEDLDSLSDFDTSINSDEETDFDNTELEQKLQSDRISSFGVLEGNFKGIIEHSNSDLIYLDELQDNVKDIIEHSNSDLIYLEELQDKYKVTKKDILDEQSSRNLSNLTKELEESLNIGSQAIKENPIYEAIQNIITSLFEVNTLAEIGFSASSNSNDLIYKESIENIRIKLNTACSQLFSVESQISSEEPKKTESDEKFQAAIENVLGNLQGLINFIDKPIFDERAMAQLKINMMNVIHNSINSLTISNLDKKVESLDSVSNLINGFIENLSNEINKL